MRELVVQVPLTAAVLGCATFAVWLLVGREAFQGGIVSVIADRGVLLFGLLAVTWASIEFAGGRWSWSARSSRFLAILATLAWLTQGAIVVLFGQALTGELRPIPLSAFVWLIATGIVLQPIVVFIGARVGSARASRSPRNRPARAIIDRGSRL